jgi:hypothetical protein
MYIHIYIYTYIHIYTYTYIYARLFVCSECLCVCVCSVDIEEMPEELLEETVACYKEKVLAEGDLVTGGLDDGSLVTLSVSEYSQLLSRLKAAEVKASSAVDSLHNAVTDLNKMRFIALFNFIAIMIKLVCC